MKHMAARLGLAIVLFALGGATPAMAAEPTVEHRTFWSSIFRKRVPVTLILPAAYSESGPRFPVIYDLHGGAGQVESQDSAWVDIVLANYGPQVTESGIVLVIPHVGAPWTNPRKEPSHEVWAEATFDPPDEVSELDPRGQEGSRPVRAETGETGLSLAQEYETHIIEELLPFVETHYRVANDRDGRGIWGQSGGCFGAFVLTLHNPDVFSFVAGSSGPLSVRHPLCVTSSCGAAIVLYGGRDPVTDEMYWRSVDPKELADNFLGAPFTILFGGGDQDLDARTRMFQEDFHQRLNELGVEHTFIRLDGVGHSPTDTHVPLVLDHFLPAAEAHFAAPSPVGRWAFRTAERRFSVWGSDFSVDRFNTEFLTLLDVGADGFVALGTGQLSVVTPPLYQPGERYRVTRISPENGAFAIAVSAEADGRLRFSVRLGEPRLVDQHTLLESAGAFDFEEFTVSIDHDPAAESDSPDGCPPLWVYPVTSCW